jgi:hypothetical protein
MLKAKPMKNNKDCASGTPVMVCTEKSFNNIRCRWRCAKL